MTKNLIGFLPNVQAENEHPSPCIPVLAKNKIPDTAALVDDIRRAIHPVRPAASVKGISRFHAK